MVQGVNTCKNVRILIEKYIEAIDTVPAGSEIRLQFGYATGFEKKSVEESKTLLRHFLKGLREIPEEAPMSLTLNVGQHDGIVNVLQKAVEAQYNTSVVPPVESPAEESSKASGDA